MFHPILFELIYGKAFEKVATTIEVVMKRGSKQRLSKPPWTAQKHILATLMRHFIHLACLIYIKEPVLDDFLKILNANRAFPQLLLLHSHSDFALYIQN